MSGWPSGLRRQTQAHSLPGVPGCIEFWSSIEGVGLNPTSDTFLFLENTLIPNQKRKLTLQFLKKQREGKEEGKLRRNSRENY
jgi:hypothetical protein